jgi:hypothetical protein
MLILGTAMFGMLPSYQESGFQDVPILEGQNRSLAVLASLAVLDLKKQS